MVRHPPPSLQSPPRVRRKITTAAPTTAAPIPPMMSHVGAESSLSGGFLGTRGFVSAPPAGLSIGGVPVPPDVPDPPDVVPPEDVPPVVPPLVVPVEPPDVPPPVVVEPPLVPPVVFEPPLVVVPPDPDPVLLAPPGSVPPPLSPIVARTASIASIVFGEVPAGTSIVFFS